MKKILLTALFGLGAFLSAYADVADWNGKFVVNNGTKSITIEHTTNYVILDGWLNLEDGSSFSSGCKVNGFAFKNDVIFKVKSNVENFINEISKLGCILSNDVKLGPNYTID